MLALLLAGWSHADAPKRTERRIEARTEARTEARSETRRQEVRPREESFRTGEKRTESREVRSEESREAPMYYADHVTGRNAQGRLHEMQIRQEYRDKGYQTHEQVHLRTHDGTMIRTDLWLRSGMDPIRWWR